MSKPIKRRTVIRLPLRLFDMQVGTIDVDVDALTGALAQFESKEPDRLLSLLRRSIEDGLFDGALDLEVFEADFAAGQRPRRADEDRRRVREAIKALKGEWGQGAVANDTEPWPALRLRFVRQAIQDLRAYEFDDGDNLRYLQEIFHLSEQGRRPKCRGGKEHAVGLAHFYADALREYVQRPALERWAWLKKQYPEVAGVMTDDGWTPDDEVTDDDVNGLALELAAKDTGYKESTIALKARLPASRRHRQNK